MSKIYSLLNKIDRPVLLLVVRKKRNVFNRYRILFPDGSIIFTYNTTYSEFHFERSCFNRSPIYKPNFKTLQDSIATMEKYDKENSLSITSIIKL